MKFKQLLQNTPALLLFIVGIASLIFANSPFSENYFQLWDFQLAHHSLRHWINDGAMTLFFLLVGIELKRELLIGELASRRTAILPVIGALGGMMAPGAIYLAMNWNSPSIQGWGIPMATDIVFALGALNLLGSTLPVSLRVFLTALAVLDDLGSILLIALFYTRELSGLLIGLAAILTTILFYYSRVRGSRTLVFLSLGLVLWIALSQAGIQPTLAGVIVAFALPMGSTQTNNLEQKLKPLVNFGILPLFVLANLGMAFDNAETLRLNHPVFLGISLGLCLGKPLGISLFSYLGIRLKITALPARASWAQFISVASLAGIGFTVSLYMAQLAFSEQRALNEARIAILTGSICSVVAGIALNLIYKKRYHS